VTDLLSQLNAPKSQQVNKVLWLHGRGLSDKQRNAFESIMRRRAINPASIFWTSMHTRIPDMGVWIGAVKKKKYKPNELRRAEFFAQLDKLLDMFKITTVVVNDQVTLAFLLQEDRATLDKYRGSVIERNGIAFIVIDDFMSIHKKKEGLWIMYNDLDKLRRWMTNAQRQEPVFKPQVVKDIPQLWECVQDLTDNAIMVAFDTETCKQGITVAGYSYLRKDGQIKSFCIPFIDPSQPDANYWQTEEEELSAWRAVQLINGSDIPKVGQHGTYDAAWFLRYWAPLKNYLCDTLHMFHSLWTESRKTIAFICSVVSDFYIYWKDESKDDTADTKKFSRVPQTRAHLERYWNYNMLDTHFTLVAAMHLVRIITSKGNEWALRNYDIEFEAQLGPAFLMTMTGMRVARHRQRHKHVKNLLAADENLAWLRTFLDEPDFNPDSHQQVATVLYDLLGAEPIKIGKAEAERSVDEKQLKFVMLQHPLYKLFIERLWECKKAQNNASKYGEMRLLTGRFIYNYSAAGTETGRYSGKKHQYYLGTNPQNVPMAIRDMFVADPGYFIFEADYSQSDAYFVAYESEDPAYIANLNSGKDSHCVHAEFFFRVPYDEIFKKTKAKDPWAVHPLTGRRSITKRLVHGANFRMRGATLYLTMGHESCVAAAHQLGHSAAHKWSVTELVKFCQQTLDRYYELYPYLPVWFKIIVEQAVQQGNRATAFGGRTRLFFGDMRADLGIQRELSAYYGQGGTAGNINRALNILVYDERIHQQGALPLLQTHDSMAFLIPDGRFDLCEKVLTAMATPCTIKGRTFTVPTAAKVGRSWCDNAMLDYRAGQTNMEMIDANEKAWEEKNYRTL
jgi:DNA polymerase I-like protein with 3'-5' exonuclease and polymerase domains